MGLKKDLEDLFLNDNEPNKLIIDNEKILKLINDISLEKLTDCITAIIAVHEVISKVQNNPELQKLSNQLIEASNLLNRLRLIIETIGNKSLNKEDDIPKATRDEDPFELPITIPRSGKITPTKAK